jgi:hypothetical protein
LQRRETQILPLYKGELEGVKTSQTRSNSPISQ